MGTKKTVGKHKQEKNKGVETPQEHQERIRIEDRTSRLEQDVEYEHKGSFSLLLRLWAYVFSSVKVISCIYLGVFIILSLLRPLLAFMLGGYIQTLEDHVPGGSFAPALALIAGYFVINFIANLIQRYVLPQEQIERLDVVQANHQQELLQSKMFKKLAAVSPEYLEVSKINDTIRQVFSWVGADWDGMNQQMMMQSYIVIAKVVSVLSIAASLYIFNPWLCLIVLAAPLPSLWSLTLGEKLRFGFAKDNTKLIRRAEYFQKLMLSPAAKEMKTLGLHDFFYAKWKVLADEYVVKEKRLIRTGTLLDMVNYFVTSLANIGGTIFAIVLMTRGMITLGALGAVMSLVSTLVSDTGDLLRSFSTFIMKKNEAARFYDMMDLPEQDARALKGQAAKGQAGKGRAANSNAANAAKGQAAGGQDCGAFSVLEAKNLKYRYPLTERYVLDGVDLRIEKGEKVALVGENGMGKTTFVKLVTGLLAPSAGELLINSVPVEDLNPSSRYDSLGAVTQEPARYNTFTVGDNVFLGDTARPRDEAAIERALEFSGLQDVGKDTLLGKDIGGADISGGQWQKLAIARAAYRDRDFIILDEPTSSLDPLAETGVFRQYIALAADKTVIFVTHRISVAALAGRIIVFARGKIAEDGSHEELMRSGGEYARLYREQARWYNR
ncbi:MAG: ABC transporter ATP-binding protein/permease [Treponema sp.]|jgi:ATP-binding cassette subfamily B protein|nr:ABC transporter ATP-binding protein/permease [Treponema sp.]